MAQDVRRSPAALGVRPAAVAILGLLGVGAGASGAASQEPLTWGEFRALERSEADASSAWGAGEAAFGEWYWPEGDGPHPVVVLVHGGCWQSIADVGYVAHLGREMAEWGWAVWAPEFRRVDQDDGAWPAILEDVAAATDFLARSGSSPAPFRKSSAGLRPKSIYR